MQHTLADPKREWEGFIPTAYRLDVQKVWHLPLNRVDQTSAGQSKTAPVKVGEVLRSLADQKIQEVESCTGTIKVITGVDEQYFEGPGFSKDVLKALLDLRKDGFNGFEALWFWYDRDYVTDMPQYSYSFFVVYKDKVIREEISFGDYHESGFDPSTFKAGDDSPPIWRSHYYWAGTQARFWYRKFYQETRRGQLMVLREDMPELYHYPEGRWRQDLALGLLYHQLTRINAALWVVVVLIALLGGILLWKL